ncbi:hypothetical protein, partial [Clostridioides difficile]|uniref:hypothetical protein n=1 Tax=Clostridioides difficile TaxID=1496 RepID=UPI003F8D7C8C
NLDIFSLSMYIESIDIINSIELDSKARYKFLSKLIIKEDTIMKNNTMYLYFSFIKNDMSKIKGTK